MKKMFLIIFSCCAFFNAKSQHRVKIQNDKANVTSTSFGFIWGAYGIHHIPTEDDGHNDKFFTVYPTLSANLALYTELTFHEVIYSLDRDLLSFQNGMYWGKENHFGTYLVLSKELSASFVEMAVGFERVFLIEGKDDFMHNKIIPFVETGFSSHKDFFVSIGVLMSNQFTLSGKH